MDIELDNWLEAANWARDEAIQQGMSANVYREHFKVNGGAREATLHLSRMGPQLVMIKFSGKDRYGQYKTTWTTWDKVSLPTSLEELISNGELSEVHWKRLLAIAQPFMEIYAGIMERLFPKAQHWELTAAPEEDYMEAVSRVPDSPRVALNPQDWWAAADWIRKNLSYRRRADKPGALVYRFGPGQDYVTISRPTAASASIYDPQEAASAELYFAFADGKHPELGRISFEIYFKGDRHYAWWPGTKNWTGAVPESLDELIDTGQSQGNVELLRERAPPFRKVYEEILRILFPRTQHWELTGAPEEDYLECIQRDTELIKRLNP